MYGAMIPASTEDGCFPFVQDPCHRRPGCRRRSAAGPTTPAVGAVDNRVLGDISRPVVIGSDGTGLWPFSARWSADGTPGRSGRGWE